MRLGATSLRRGLAALVLRPALWAWPAAVLVTALGVSAHLDTPEHGNRVFASYYLPSTLLIALGCLPSLITRRRAVRPEADSVLPRRVLVWATVAVLGAACALRVIGLDTWPPPNGTAFEEAQLGQEAKVVLDYRAVPNEHVLAITVPALSYRLFGVSISTLRLPSVVLGLLTPLFVYAACRRLVAWEVALFATALFGVSWWSVTSSRVADEIFFPAGLVPLVLLFLVDYTQTARAWSAFGLAVVSGLLLYEYTGYHIAAVLVLGYFLVALALRVGRWGLASPRPALGRVVVEQVRRWGPGIFVIAMVWTNLAMRQVVGDVVLGNAYLIEGFNRHQLEGCGLAGVNRDELASYVSNRLQGVYHGAFSPAGGDDVPVTGMAGHPLFDAATAWSLAIGGALAAVTFWRPFHLFVWAWVAGAVIVASVFPCNTNPHRLYTVLPLVYVLIALGGQVLWDWVGWRSARAVVLALFAVAVVVAAKQNLSHLWTEFLHPTRMLAMFDEPSTRVTLWIAQREPDSLTWVLSERYEHLGHQSDYHWMLDGRRAVAADSISAVLPSPEIPAGPLYFLVISRPEQPGIRDLIAEYYPSVEQLDVSPLALPDANVQVFKVPAHATRAERLPVAGFVASYAASRSPGADAATLPDDARLLLERREPLLSVLSMPFSLKRRYLEEAGRGLFLWGMWEGELDGEGASEATFRAYVRGGEAWVSINGAAAVHVVAAREAERSLPFRATLRPGRNTIRFVQRVGLGEIVGAQLFRTMPDGREVVVAAPFDSARLVSLLSLDPVAVTLDGGASKPERVPAGYTADSVPYGGGFSVQPTSALTFRLPDGAEEFQAMAFLRDDIRSCPEASLSFAVRAEDGTVLAESGRIDPTRPQASIRADLRGQRVIRLEMDDGGDGDQCDVGVWGDPVVLISGIAGAAG